MITWTGQINRTDRAINIKEEELNRRRSAMHTHRLKWVSAMVGAWRRAAR